MKPSFLTAAEYADLMARAKALLRTNGRTLELDTIEAAAAGTWLRERIEQAGLSPERCERRFCQAVRTREQQLRWIEDPWDLSWKLWREFVPAQGNA